MKRRLVFSIALALGVVMLALISSASTVRAQPGKTFVVDSGVVSLGPNQLMRITVANGLDPATVRFKWLKYTSGSCAAAVCRHLISSQVVSDPIALAPGEAASYNEGDTASHVRGVVSANRKDLKVLFQIVNAATGEVETAWYTCSGGTCETQ